jgi:hypothetical protein
MVDRIPTTIAGVPTTVTDVSSVIVPLKVIVWPSPPPPDVAVIAIVALSLPPSLVTVSFTV